MAKAPVGWAGTRVPEQSDGFGDVYTFGPIDNVQSRVRRLERGEQYLRAGVLVSPSGKYAGVPKALLDGNKIDLTSKHLSTKGSIPPFGVVGNFGYSATTTSITLYWDGTNSSAKLKIIRTDGSAVNIPASSLTITGLIANTSYGFLPFWSALNNCGIGFIKGDSGSPQFAFTAAARNIQASVQQSYQGNEPLTNGFILFSTPSAGTGGGTGTGGGGGGVGGSCIMVGTHVETMGGGEYVMNLFPQTDWVNLAAEDYPRTLNCTPNHPLYHPERGQMRADSFNVGDWIVTEKGERKLAEVRPFFRVCTKVQVAMSSGHLFFANGFLSHNIKYNNPL
jgi:hypothetical protein